MSKIKVPNSNVPLTSVSSNRQLLSVGSKDGESVIETPQKKGKGQKDGDKESRKPEIRLMHLVKNGDVEAVERQLMQNMSLDSFDINHNFVSGLTVLELAVTLEDIPMVKTLLTFPGISVKQALLHAVRLSNLDLVKIFLSHQSDDDVFASGPAPTSPTTMLKTKASLYDSIEYFSADMTPLMLACHLDDKPIINVLMLKGHSLQKPCMPRCKCEKCLQTGSVPLEESLAQLNLYKAWSCPHSLIHMGDDPIFEAFHMSHLMKERSMEEPEFKDDYIALSAKLRMLAVDFLGECRSHKEVEFLLQRQKGAKEYKISKPKKWCRLRLAIHLEQKEFVAHPHCQQVLRQIWMSGFEHWRQGWRLKIMLLLLHLVMFPVSPFLFFCVPGKKIKEYWRRPISKCLNEQISYVIFMSLLLLDIMYFCPFIDKDHRPGNLVQWIIAIWSLTSVINLLKEAGHQRLDFKKFWINIYDLVMFFLMFASVLCMLVRSLLAKEWLEEQDINNGGGEVDASTLQMLQHYLEYIPPRHLWQWYEPFLWMESGYAIAIILAFARIIYLFLLTVTLGPMQLALGRMMADITKFLFLFCIMLMAFALGLMKIYGFYKGHQRTDEDGTTREQEEGLVSLRNTLKTLFWTIFGMVELSTADVVVGGENSTVTVKHYITESAGFIVFGLYHVIAIILLLNMLIAMLNSSYSQIENNLDLEWKFARSRLWMCYFEKGTTLPPPFNILPSPKNIKNLFLWMQYRWCSDSDEIRPLWNTTRCFYLEKKSEIKEEDRKTQLYERFVKLLYLRYCNRRTLHAESENSVTQSDFKQLLQMVKNIKSCSCDGKEKSNVTRIHKDLNDNVATPRSKKKIIPLPEVKLYDEDNNQVDEVA
ncbi:short transient receptor potential channel 4 [Lingula anatina]|uniref:Short transient receptor potential channel 4 n=1 Tax=Lingula anatina TaxID=7574 RepID=A0A1S3HKY2_LINAN|nr:short transient receptor potential channel 4 [Lingula anatina]|eukprot:XP_013386770.1 short transient receptor potential channel 4 [Lingula anatina]